MTDVQKFDDGTTCRLIGRVDGASEEGGIGASYCAYFEIDRVVTEEWVTENFPSEPCQHSYDCCGCWYPYLGQLVGTDDVCETSVVSQYYHLNV